MTKPNKLGAASIGCCPQLVVVRMRHMGTSATITVMSLCLPFKVPEHFCRDVAAQPALEQPGVVHNILDVFYILSLCLQHLGRHDIVLHEF